MIETLLGKLGFGEKEIKINNYWVFVIQIKITKKCEVLNDIPFNHYQYIVADDYSFDFYLHT
jgi:hypothetical protein